MSDDDEPLIIPTKKVKVNDLTVEEQERARLTAIAAAVKDESETGGTVLAEVHISNGLFLIFLYVFYITCYIKILFYRIYGTRR